MAHKENKMITNGQQNVGGKVEQLWQIKGRGFSELKQSYRVTQAYDIPPDLNILLLLRKYVFLSEFSNNGYCEIDKCFGGCGESETGAYY